VILDNIALEPPTSRPIGIIVLGQASVALAKQIATALPNCRVYGLNSRTTGVDHSFENFGETVQELFSQGTAIVGVCAAGILIRTVAPLLSNKWQEPPVLAVAEDGSAVVPLLGGLQGANDLARQIAALLDVSAAITTTGEIRFQMTLLSPPTGYTLAHPELAKTFIADLLAGDKVRIEGEADWLKAANLPFDPQADRAIVITERVRAADRASLVYHPATVALGLSCSSAQPGAETAVIDWIIQTLTTAGIAPAAVAGIFTLDQQVTDPVVKALADHQHWPLRFFRAGELGGDEGAGRIAQLAAQSQTLAHQATTEINGVTYGMAIVIAAQPIDLDHTGHRLGHLAIVGLGPGRADWLSPQAKQVLQAATDWVGYHTYLNLAEPLRQGQQRHESDNREELDRARFALDLAAKGRSVAIISSGDPGIYAMAAAVFEAIDQRPSAWAQVEIQVCPGISAMQAAAAQIGAPIGHDFCAISLSDILKPWDTVVHRLSAAAEGDFVIAIYNPISSQRRWQLMAAKAVLLRWRRPDTPIVLARNVGRPGQSVRTKPLGELTNEDADMRTILLIGSSQTRVIVNDSGPVWVYTPRSYHS
jgi:cobalt-precorrin 5A hydrolase / precorrin-3B C17-methyltransferase